MTTKEKIADVCARLQDTLIAKNEAYGDAVSRTPILCPSLDARTAILVRMSDKLSRLANLQANSPDDLGETFDDTILDLAGYCVLYLANDGRFQGDDHDEN